METWVEGATGLGINDNILSAYMFLAQNFVPDDEIFIFGFSRGAFTARSLAGFVTACGLLKRQRLGDIPAAWTYYRSPPPHSPAKFKELSGTDSYLDPQIKFLGVWDTGQWRSEPTSHLSFAGLALAGIGYPIWEAEGR